MDVLMQSGECSVTDDGGLITVRPRVVTLLLFFACGMAAALALAVLSVWMAGPLPALGAFARWGATVLALVSLCFPVAAGVASATRRVTIDPLARTVSRGRARWTFADIGGIAVNRRSILDQEVLTIVATVNGVEQLLVTGHTPKHVAGMERAATRMAAIVTAGGGRKAASAAITPADPGRVAERFLGLFLTAFGLILSVTAGAMIPDLVLTRHGAGFGFLFWPVGIWIAAAGALELFGINPARARVVQPVALRVIIVAGWCVSYLVIALRPL